MDQILIWGIGQFYDTYIAHHVLSKELNVVGFITGIKTVCSVLDHRRIYMPDEIQDINFDYIIIANQNNYLEIRSRLVLEYKIPEEKCINGKVFKNPCFNWERYKKIINERPSIIAEACYGGYIYNQLGMRFYSPFINTRIFEYDYIKILRDLDFYLQQDIYSIRDIQNSKEMGAEIGKKEISWGKMGYPIAGLGDVQLHAIHANSIAEYMVQWERRRERINKKNVWVMMIIENDDMADAFAQIEATHKVGFYFKQTDCKDIVCLNDWQNYSSRQNSGHDFLSYVHHLIWDDKILRYVDIFKLFSCEEDFIRLY